MNKIKNDYKTSNLAEEDLIDIFLKSIEGWGISKARQYSQAIEDTFNRLARHPDLGKSRDELFPGALSFPVGSHIIFYRKAAGIIEIARILHRRMDYRKHLDDEVELSN